MSKKEIWSSAFFGGGREVVLLVLLFIVASKRLYNYVKTNKVISAPSELFLPCLTFKRKQNVQEKQIPLITVLKA